MLQITASIMMLAMISLQVKYLMHINFMEKSFHMKKAILSLICLMMI